MFNPTDLLSTDNTPDNLHNVNGGKAKTVLASVNQTMSEEEFKKLLNRAMRHEQQLRKKIRKARKNGKKGWLRNHVHRYLTSYDAKLTVLVNRIKDMRRGTKLKPNFILSLVDQITLYAGCDEIVKVNVRPKKSGSDYGRPVLSFGHIERTRQEMLRRVMKDAVKEPCKNQFSTRRGVNRAIRLVKKHLVEGFVHVIEADIVSCYANYDKSKLPELFDPIPAKIIQEVLVPNLMGRLELYKESPLWVSQSDLNAPLAILEQKADPVFLKARCGLMQGSAASPLASELLLAEVMRVMTDAPGPVVNYADNFVLMAKTPNDALTMYKALFVLLRKHPAGPLSLKIEWRTFKDNGCFEFLGYIFEVTEKGFSIEPTNDNRQKFHEQVNREYKRILSKDMSPTRRMARIKELRGYVNSWTGAFIEAPEAVKIRKLWFSRLDTAENSNLLFKSDFL